VQVYVGLRLQSSFDHDFVFIADAADRFLYASLGLRSVDPNWFNSIQPDLKGVLDLVRGRSSPGGTVLEIEPGKRGGLPRAARLQGFLGRPAIVAAVAVATPSDVSPRTGAEAPIVLSVKFIDDDVLADIASRLLLRNLHKVDKVPPAAGEHVLDLIDERGHSIAQFAWMPKQPGAEIVHSVAPFIAIALAAFALLVGLVLGHMRRTAATIEAGETRLRHLALHDPLCGCRIGFSLASGSRP
jgi:sensor domain CHASE-containing protein